MHIGFGTSKKFLFVPFILSLTCLSPQLQALEDSKYLNMSLQDLLNVEVSSVSKKMELLRNAGAAVFVISNDDLRRSGATSIPEALRMAPGLNVARINASSWAVSARGFNGRFANKLLVLMDGRSVYESSFSGVYWDVQDTMIEDIERIEVIRGPGATLWGSNAVNGIINIISKHSIDAQGGRATVAVGSHEKIGSFRYGGSLSDNVYGRTYLKYKKQKNLVDTLHDTNAGDDWASLRGGFRIDGELGGVNKLTLQGDTYQNKENQIVQLWQPTAPYQGNVKDAFSVSGWNTLMRWEHVLDNDSATTLQVYYDHTKRDEVYAGQQHDTFDVDFQHNFNLGQSQHVVWGLGYRNIKEIMRNSFSTSLINNKPENVLLSGFLQDDIKLFSDDLRLVLGSKFERNEYTGWEVQPNIRLTWALAENQTLWASVSKAVRTPSRFEAYAQAVAYVMPPNPPFVPVPITVHVVGNPNFESERLTAYEMGYRAQALDNVNIDIAVFNNVYDKLRSYERSQVQPRVLVDNQMKGCIHGFEVTANWQAYSWWQLHLAYSNQRNKLELLPNSTDRGSLLAAQGSSPKHQVSLRSNMSLSSNIELDIWGRYNGGLSNTSPNPAEPSINTVKAYTELDVRLGWKLSESAELSLVGKNLLQANHLEFIQESFIRATSVERSISGNITLTF